MIVIDGALPPLVDNGRGTSEVEFESVSHMARVALASGTGACREAAVACDLAIASIGRSMGASPDSVRRSMVQAPPALLARVERMKSRLEGMVQPPTRRRRKLRRHLDDGTDLDPQAAFERRADGWEDVERRRVVKHVVTVGVNTVTPWNARPEHLAARGATAAAVADLLTQGGHSVEVVALQATSGPASGIARSVSRVTVKPADSPLDIGTLAVALGDLAFARMVMMVAENRCMPVRPDSRFGLPAMLTREERASFDVLIDSAAFDEETALRYVAAAVAKFGEVDR